MSGVDIEIGAAAGVGLSDHMRARIPGRVSTRFGDATSRPIEVTASWTSAGLTYGFLTFPAVSPNKIWEVMRVSFYQNDPWAVALTNAVMLFRSSMIPQDSATEPTAFGAFIGSSNAPGAFNAAVGGAVLVRNMERVYAAFKAVALGVQIIASMDAIEHDLEAFLKQLASR